jgi:hypothetical protein
MNPIDTLTDAFSRRPATETTSAELARRAAAALAPLIDELDNEQGPANFEEDNYEAGWHAALYELRKRLGSVGGAA